jgi:hypothetical protein
MTTVADRFVETVATAGVNRFYGIVADSPRFAGDARNRLRLPPLER